MKALFVLLVVSAAAHAQLSTADSAVQSACTQTAATPLPADMADLPVPRIYPECDSYSLYDKKNYKDARACAIQERLALLARLPDSPSAPRVAGSANDGFDPAGGLVVLSQLYANAEGVAQNPALARRFFCEAMDTNEVEHDSSVTQNILATLQRLGKITPASPHFALCVTTGSDYPSNTNSVPPPDTPPTRYCDQKEGDEWEAQHAAMHGGGIEQDIDEAEKDASDAAAALQPALRKLTPTQHAAYGHLTAAFDAFIAKQVTGVSLFCPPYSRCDIPGSHELSDNEEHAAFDNQVAAFLKAAPPTPNSADFNTADAALNRVYRDLIAAATQAASVPHSGVTPDMLRTEQRVWLAYRDAFASFGKTLYPSLPPSAWLLPLTTARSSDLEQVYDRKGTQWIEDAQKHQAFLAQNVAAASAETSSRRAQVSRYFDHQTPEQAAAWQRVQAALTVLATAHNAADSRC